MQFRLYLLGAPRIERAGIQLTLNRHKALALLAYLALTRQQHQRDMVATMLWPELDQSGARAGLRRVLVSLRKALGAEALVADRETVALAPDLPLWLDVDRFGDLLAACASHDHDNDQVCTACIPLIDEAASLYRGDLLEGFSLPDAPAFDDWVYFQRQDLRAQVTPALMRLSQWHAEQGQMYAAIDAARRLLALDPLQEETHRQLMQLYAQAGNVPAALRQYEECVRVLETEMDVPPAPETLALHEQIRRARKQAHAPQHTAVPSMTSTLPAPVTPLVGRTAEIRRVTERLQDDSVRLVTLTGPGGVGKTRLALRVAENFIGEFSHGVHFVPLASLQDPSLVLTSVVQALDVRGDEELNPLVRLQQFLRRKSMLLVLDNFEHVIEAAPQISELLVSCPHLHILVTSREALRVQGEHEMSVPALSIPSADDWSAPDQLLTCAAVQLFVQCAKTVQPEFSLSPGNAPAVAEICTRLEGLPLAIELAAARAKVFSPQALLRRLVEVEVSPSAQLMRNTRRDASQRHRSLWHTIDWSYNLLSPEEQSLFRRLAIFAGGCTLPAAEAVADATGESETNLLDLLTSLVDKSLLQQGIEPDGEPRFRMLESMRAYGLEQLRNQEEMAAVQSAHASYFLALARQASAHLNGPEQRVWLDRLAEEHDNLRLALGWAVEKKFVPLAVDLVFALWRFWYIRGHAGEGMEWFTTLQALADRQQQQVQILFGLGMLARRRADGQAARAYLEACLALMQQGEADPFLVASATWALGFESYRRGDYPIARKRFEKSWKIFRMIGDEVGIATALRGLGVVAGVRGDLEESIHLLTEALAIWRRLGDEYSIALSVQSLGYLFLKSRKHKLARDYFQEALEHHQSLGNQLGAATVLLHLGTTAMAGKELETARHLFEEAYTLAQEADDRMLIADLQFRLATVALAEDDLFTAEKLLRTTLETASRAEEMRYILRTIEYVAALAVKRKHYHVALQIAGAATVLRRKVRDARLPVDEEAFTQTVAAAQTALSQGEVYFAQSVGETMTVEDVVALALKEVEEESIAGSNQADMGMKERSGL